MGLIPGASGRGASKARAVSPAGYPQAKQIPNVLIKSYRHFATSENEGLAVHHAFTLSIRGRSGIPVTAGLL
jgi:hypothetical protein